jgi:parvulin-like peptidyl-prolyl isomerase
MPVLDAAIDNRRSMIFLGVGAVAGLALAGYSLFTARGTSTLFVPAEDVALVNTQPISRQDFWAEVQTLYGVDQAHATAAQRRAVLEAMIREELFVQRGKELDLASSDPEVRSALVNAVEAEIAQDAMTTQPDDEALRGYFEAHAARYSTEGVMSVRDIVFPPADRRLSEQAAAAFHTAPPAPDSLAKFHATVSQAVGDEEFYFAAQIRLGPQLFAVARELADGGVSPPIDSGGHIHIIYMIHNRKPAPLSFPEARDRVLHDLRGDAVSRLRSGDESFLRKRATIRVAEDQQ